MPTSLASAFRIASSALPAAGGTVTSNLAVTSNMTVSNETKTGQLALSNIKRDAIDAHNRWWITNESIVTLMVGAYSPSFMLPAGLPPGRVVYILSQGGGRICARDTDKMRQSSFGTSGVGNVTNMVQSKLYTCVCDGDTWLVSG